VKPRLLDLFCGAGGCTKGFQRAGFEVVGVDISPQPNYCGDDFVQMDALEFLRRLLDGERVAGYVLSDFVAVHASPPCQGYSDGSNIRRPRRSPASSPDVRELLERPAPVLHRERGGRQGALRNPVTLCGAVRARPPTCAATACSRRNFPVMTFPVRPP
jgi:DNA (cytosine-5)-methyltransferase 1